MPTEERLQRLQEEVVNQRPRVFKYCKKHLLDSLRGDITEAAKDITQGVMVKAIEKIAEYHDQGNLSAWILRIAHNEMVNYVKKERRMLLLVDFLPPDESVEDINWEFVFMGFDEPDLFDRCLELEEVRLAVDCYRKLLARYPKCFEAFSQVVILDHTYKEAAHKLGVPVGTIKSQVHRAWRRIQLTR